MTILGTAADDDLSGTAHNDQFDVSQGGNDTITAGDGRDTFFFGAAFTADDVVNGGKGFDTLALDGDYTGPNAIVFNIHTMTQVESITLAAGHSYTLTMKDANLHNVAGLGIDGSALGAGDSLRFNDAAETDVSVSMTGGAGNDRLVGGQFDNDFILDGGGDDFAKGGAGGDDFTMGAALTAYDRIDGGGDDGAFDVDRVILFGDYSAGLTLGAHTLVNIERISMAVAPFSYKLTTNDANFAAGTISYIDAISLPSDNFLNFNGSAETDASFHITVGLGDHILRTGAGDDVFVFDGTLRASDRIDGGTGNDTVELIKGESVALGPHTLKNVENILLSHNASYQISTADATAAAGITFTVDASILGHSQALTFDGSNDTDSHFAITGGHGADTLTGGALGDVFAGGQGADTLTGNSSGDTFAYTAVTDSSAAARDHITDFDASSDFIDLWFVVNAVASSVTAGTLDEGSFSTDLASAIGSGQLPQNDVVVFTPDNGDLAGHTFLVVDGNGTAGYQAAGDMVIQIDDALHLDQLATSNFT